MNKRIQELIDQATTIEYGADNGFDRISFDKEKFAKLIILECANQAAWAQDTGSADVAADIVKYFGVEE